MIRKDRPDPHSAIFAGSPRRAQSSIQYVTRSWAPRITYSHRAGCASKDDASREAARQSLTQTLRWFESYNTANHYETAEEAKRGYPSTVQAHEPVAMKETLRSLKSPQWPEKILPPIIPFVFDTSVTGNSNRGHEYGVTLPDADRWALVEYLKTL